VSALPGVSAGVSRIIDSVVGSLLLNPDRTFVFADMVRGAAAAPASRGGAG